MISAPHKYRTNHEFDQIFPDLLIFSVREFAKPCYYSGRTVPSPILVMLATAPTFCLYTREGGAVLGPSALFLGGAMPLIQLLGLARLCQGLALSGHGRSANAVPISSLRLV